MIRLDILQGEEKGRCFEQDEERFTIGRGPAASLQLTDYHLSGEHGLIFREQDSYIYRDLRSTNGTMLLRGQKRYLLDGNDRWELALVDGDRLLLGDAASPVIILCKLEALDETAEAAQRIIATRALADLPQVVGKVEQGPDLATLHQAMKKLVGGLDFTQVNEALVQAVFDILPRTTHVSLLLADGADENRFSPVLARSRQGTQHGELITISRSVLRKVLKDRAGILAANAADELGGAESIMGANIRSVIGVPLWQGERICGVIECDNRASSGIFTERDLELLLTLASQASLAIENARLFQQLVVAKDKLERENTYLRKQQSTASFDQIIGEAPAMKDIFNQLEKVIDTRATVCISGETGTGKELVARAIHYQGRRREKMFVAQNCAALPDNLLESELFGHRKGAFTGAESDKKGLFEIADGGTLFLDEIAEMSTTLQAKLLRVLQEGELRPVGATRSKQVDVRIICATHRNLQQEVEAARFREDLYYRLMVFPITLPPLRERREDIPLLLQHFLKRYGRELRKTVGGISQPAARQLAAYEWRGNIRELENEVQRLLIQVDEGAIIQPEHLSPEIRKVESMVERISPQKGSLKDMMEEVERWLLTKALKDHGNNKTKTAVTLGITREGLHKKLSKYDM